VADEPTLGEIGRGLEAVRRAMDQLSGKVLTVEVWKAEKESMDFRMRENEKDIATVQAEAKADRDKREQEKDAETVRANTQRREIRFILFTALIAPIIVGVAVAWVMKG
jgi:hypothetical protein